MLNDANKFWGGKCENELMPPRARRCRPCCGSRSRRARAPTLIVVVPDGYALLGTSAANSGELLKLLMDRKITSVDLRTEGSNDYEKIGRAIYAFQRWVIDLVHIDDRDVKALAAAERRTADPAERTVPPTRADADK
jgi:hypothetical protein